MAVFLSGALGCVGPAPVPCVTCGDSCVDTQVDSNNCGSCGNACSAGQRCELGSCQDACADTQTSCNGICVDTQTDPANCGNCGMACPQGQICTEGGCLAACSEGLTPCAMTCFDTVHDPDHCGGCDIQCTPQNALMAICSASICGFAGCADGFADCDGFTQNGCEADITLDPQNCGGCGIGCFPANVTDQPDAGLDLDGGLSSNDGGTPDAGPAHPPKGAVCAGEKCDYLYCTAGYADCDGIRANGCEASIWGDPLHCGDCGTVCPSGICNHGICQ